MPNGIDDPIVVEVQDGRWNAYSTNPTPTPRDLYLFGLLMGLGGVQDTVEDGNYHFNIDGGNLTSFTIVNLTKVP